MLRIYHGETGEGHEMTPRCLMKDNQPEVESKVKRQSLHQGEG